MKKKLQSLGVNVYSINPFINFNLEGHKYMSDVRENESGN